MLRGEHNDHVAALLDRDEVIIQSYIMCAERTLGFIVGLGSGRIADFVPGAATLNSIRELFDPSSPLTTRVGVY
jgi:hypothetical protein